MGARLDGKRSARCGGITTGDPLALRTMVGRRVAGSMAQLATTMQSALQSGPQSETDLKDAIRAAGFTSNDNTFTQAIAWLRTHRGLESKPRRPRGRIYTLPTARGIDPGD